MRAISARVCCSRRQSAPALGLFHAAGWLSAADQPQQADAILVLGGSFSRPFEAAELYRRGLARKIYVSAPVREQQHLLLDEAGYPFSARGRRGARGTAEKEASPRARSSCLGKRPDQHRGRGPGRARPVRQARAQAAGGDFPLPSAPRQDDILRRTACSRHTHDRNQLRPLARSCGGKTRAPRATYCWNWPKSPITNSAAAFSGHLASVANCMLQWADIGEHEGRRHQGLDFLPRSRSTKEGRSR